MGSTLLPQEHGFDPGQGSSDPMPEGTPTPKENKSLKLKFRGNLSIWKERIRSNP